MRKIILCCVLGFVFALQNARANEISQSEKVEVFLSPHPVVLMANGDGNGVIHIPISLFPLEAFLYNSFSIAIKVPEGILIRSIKDCHITTSISPNSTECITDIKYLADPADFSVLPSRIPISFQVENPRLIGNMNGSVTLKSTLGRDVSYKFPIKIVVDQIKKNNFSNVYPDDSQYVVTCSEVDMGNPLSTNCTPSELHPNPQPFITEFKRRIKRDTDYYPILCSLGLAYGDACAPSEINVSIITERLNRYFSPIPESSLTAVRVASEITLRGRTKIKRDAIIDGYDSSKSKIKLDIGGEGVHEVEGLKVGFPDTVNINIYNKKTSAPFTDIPNLLLADAADLPFEDNFADFIAMQNGPLFKKVMKEMARVIRAPGVILIQSTFKGDEQLKKFCEDLKQEISLTGKNAHTANYHDEGIWGVTCWLAVFYREEMK
jgi:SAM-dependent methyltransferase